MSFRAVGIEIAWSGTGVDERGIDVQSGVDRVRINPRFYRPAEVELLIGNAALAKKELGWAPKTTLEELCKSMVEADLLRVNNGLSW
jgi:GDPmannose 4,6-dehydratase